MTNLPYSYKEQGLKYLEEVSPEFHNLVQKGIRQAEKEKINKQVEEAKKVLGYEEKEKLK